MITTFDHIVMTCADLDSAVAEHARMLGREPDWRAVDLDAGTATAVFALSNMALELIAPQGEGPVGARLKDLLDNEGEGLASLAFASDGLSEDHRLLTRRGLNPDPIQKGQSADTVTGRQRRWLRTRLDKAETGGVRVFVLETPTEDRIVMKPGDAAAAGALDHVVIQTHQPDRAAAIYGARLGIPMALDRTSKEWGTRFLFFPIGGSVLEIIHRLDQPVEPDTPDKLWGITWRTADIEAARERLSQSGFEVSDIRQGRKPGTRVFTVRDAPCNVPTLFLEQAPRNKN